MKKTLLILGIALTSLISCQKSPTFEECSVGYVFPRNESQTSNGNTYLIRNVCSHNIKEVALTGGVVESDLLGTYVTLNKPW